MSSLVDDGILVPSPSSFSSSSYQHQQSTAVVVEEEVQEEEEKKKKKITNYETIPFVRRRHLRSDYDDDSDEDDDYGRSNERRGGCCRHSSTKKKRSSMPIVLLALLLLSISAIIVCSSYYIIIPTQEELELARENNNHAGSFFLFGGVRKIRSQQQFANTQLLTLSRMTGVNSAVDKAYTQIDKKDSAKHYSDPSEGCEATVIIIRHCEKRSIREHCAEIGYERSVYLATLFGTDDKSRWPAPSYIFAEGPGHRNNPSKMNFRELETVGPLAEKLNLDVDDSYTDKNVNKLTTKLLTFLQTGKMCGKVTLLSWKHSQIGHIARHLGCGPSQGCPSDYHGSTFDDTWHMKFIYDVQKHSSAKNLALPKKPSWRVYGSIQKQNFDPLAFSKAAGDYPPGGTDHGPRWKKRQVDVPERKTPKDKSTWQETRVGFDDSNNNQ